MILRDNTMQKQNFVDSKFYFGQWPMDSYLYGVIEAKEYILGRYRICKRLGIIANRAWVYQTEAMILE